MFDDGVCCPIGVKKPLLVIARQLPFRGKKDMIPADHVRYFRSINTKEALRLVVVSHRNHLPAARTEQTDNLHYNLVWQHGMILTQHRGEAAALFMFVRHWEDLPERQRKGAGGTRQT